MNTDLARLLADVVFLAGSIISALEKRFAVALVAAGLFLLSIAAGLKG